jgi:hypothetical protein
MPSDSVRGSCLCGSVRFEVELPFRTFRYCHCSRCRKATGSAFAANLFVEPAQFEWISGEDSLTRFDLPEARHFASCFCNRCGSPLPRLTRGGTVVVVPSGSLDGDPAIRPEHHIFWDSRAPWFSGEDELPRFGEYPPSA